MLFCLLLLCLAVPASAAAQGPSTDFIHSDAFSHVANIQYEQRYDSGGNHGSDIEFATITVPEPQASNEPPAAVKKPVKKRSKRAACIAKAKRKHGKARKRALRKCKAKARRSAADVEPQTPGVQRTFAFAGTYYNGLQIVDVSDPEHPQPVTAYDCAIAQGDVQVFFRKDLGRWFVGYGADDPYSNNSESACYVEAAKRGFDTESNGNSGTFFIDVTDPYHPYTVSFLPFKKGSHNLTIHPSGKYLYNSNSDTVTTFQPAIEVADISNIEHPKEITQVPLQYRPGLGSESHDISFSPDGKRAYSAAVSQGVILDTSDPAKPKVIATIFDPSLNVWHQAEAIESNVPGLGERTLLIGSDEFAGASGTGQCPNGGLHIYDITGPLESQPVPIGVWNFDDVRQTADGVGVCTAHVFQLWPDQGIMVIANYNGGVHVLDISSLWGLGAGSASTGITELGNARFPDSETWAVKSPHFDRKGTSYLFGNDEVRGMDVYRFKLPAR